MIYRFCLLAVSLGFFIGFGCVGWTHPPGENGHHEHDDFRVMTSRDSVVHLPPPPEEDVFHFVIYGDRTGGVPEGLKVLERAVDDTNLLAPDLVMTVGDLIQGYNDTPPWMLQMKEFKGIMEGLDMPWYPVAGNHDVYWRGKDSPPTGHHEKNYEAHFGPLWYAFEHKHAGFIVLYSDEGDSETNKKGFNDPELQQFSDAQLGFLDKTLNELKDKPQVFVFMHHPRWIESRYKGSNWDIAHKKLVRAGNVRAVFGGHIHQMHFGGTRDGISYYALATTGGNLSADIPGAGYLHHLNMVSVRPNAYQVAALPIGSVVDPKEFTQAFHEDIRMARKISPQLISPALQIQPDESVEGNAVYELKNPCQRSVDISLALEMNQDWKSDLDHRHETLEPGQSVQVEFSLSRKTSSSAWLIPRLVTQIQYVGQTSRVELPNALTPISLDLSHVAADYFSDTASNCLSVQNSAMAMRIETQEVPLKQSPFTLECWIRPSDVQQYRAIAAKTQNSEYALFLDEGAPEFSVLLGDRYVVAKSTRKVAKDQWTHVAGVYDGSAVNLYVNGQRVDSRQAKGRRKTNALPLWIGADPDGAGNPTRAFAGDIDEVRLSKQAMYDTESFEPARRFVPEPSTVWLNHFDRRFGPYELNHADGGGKALLGAESMLVPAE